MASPHLIDLTEDGDSSSTVASPKMVMLLCDIQNPLSQHSTLATPPFRKRNLSCTVIDDDNEIDARSSPSFNLSGLGKELDRSSNSSAGLSISAQLPFVDVDEKWKRSQRSHRDPTLAAEPISSSNFLPRSEAVDLIVAERDCDSAAPISFFKTSRRQMFSPSSSSVVSTSNCNAMHRMHGARTGFKGKLDAPIADTPHRPCKRARRSSQVGAASFYGQVSVEPNKTEDLEAGTATADAEFIDITRLFPVSKKSSTAIKDAFDRNGEDARSIIDLEDEAVRDEERYKTIIALDDYCTDEQLPRILRELSVRDITTERQMAPGKTYCTQRSDIRYCKFGNSTIVPGKSVEFLDNTFLRVCAIFTTNDAKVVLSGKHMIRQNFLGPMMPKKRNELVWMIDKAETPAGTGENIGTKEVALDQVKRLRCITFTNQHYGSFSLRDHASEYATAKQAVEEGTLFCRWKKIKVRTGSLVSTEESIVRISFKEADAKLRDSRNPRVDATKLRTDWRGVPTIPGGGHTGFQNIIGLDGNSTSEKFQKYTYGDAFCGAGGASRGALDAGLQVEWGFDMDPAAIKSYKANFGKLGTKCFQKSVDEFLRRPNLLGRIVDILHMSPPCQPFSPAHTIPNEENDAKNLAALFSVQHLLEAIRPRVATIEETYGLISRFHEWYSALINIFVSLGYSVRWKVLKLDEFAVPQPRKRLFLIAASPGEVLPPFPVPTHGASTPGLKNVVTINDVIKNIPLRATHHDIVFWPLHEHHLPFSADSLAKTVTCNGGIGNYHPSGKRNFTVRETACLQTFPVHHSFADAGITAARKQVGNAVPPVMAKALFRTVIKSLQDTDRQET